MKTSTNVFFCRNTNTVYAWQLVLCVILIQLHNHTPGYVLLWRYFAKWLTSTIRGPQVKVTIDNVGESLPINWKALKTTPKVSQQWNSASSLWHQFLPMSFQPAVLLYFRLTRSQFLELTLSLPHCIWIWVWIWIWLCACVCMCMYTNVYPTVFFLLGEPWLIIKYSKVII